MDEKELEEADALTTEELVAKLKNGRPAHLDRKPRSRDTKQLASAIIGTVAERSEVEVQTLYRPPIRPLSYFIALGDESVPEADTVRP